MSARKRLRSVTRSACAVLALVAAVGVGPVVAPAPARAADTVRDLQWHLDALKIPEAHRLTKGRGVTVAVIDSGVDAGHPDLRGQVLRGRGFGAGAAADGRTDPDREAGHGTGMAGIIAGRGGGDMHALGIAPEAKILPIGLGDGGLREAPTGVRWAVDSGADVINLSLGAHGDDPEMVEAVRYALGKNVVVVASTGNRDSGYREIPVPASVPGVLAVGGATRSGALWGGTVTGPAMAISAPGEDIIAPAPSAASPNGYLVSDGTSNSSAIVSGIAALIRARYPDLDAANVVNRLVATARDRGPKGRDPEYGFGSVDVMAALTRSVPAVQANPLAAAAGASASPGAPTGEAEGKDDDGPAVSIGLADNAGIQIVLCLLAVLVAVAVVVILLVVNRRSRRRARAGAPPGVQQPGHPVPGAYPPPGTYQPHPHGGFRPPPGPQPYPTAAPGQHPYPPAPGQHPYPPAPGGPPVTAPPYGPPHQPGPPGPVPPTPPGTPPTDPQPRQ